MLRFYTRFQRLFLVRYIFSCPDYVDSPSHYLGGVEFAVVQLQNVQRRLQVGLGLRQLHLDGSQTVGVRRGQVHPQQRQIYLQDGGGGGGKYARFSQHFTRTTNCTTKTRTCRENRM